MSDSPTSHSANGFNLSCAAMFGGLMCAGVWQMYGAVRSPDEFKFPSDWTSFRTGAMTQTLEKQLEQRMPVRDSLITAANSVRYLLLSGAGDQVRLGSDGWLFLTEELRHWGDRNAARSPEQWFEQRMNLIAEVASRLERQEIRLLVALVPDKARINHRQLTGMDYPQYNQGRYTQALNALKQRRVETVDLFKPLADAATQGEVYYRTDTHWNQAGARLAAQTLAERIRSLNLELEPVKFVTSVDAQSQSRDGDLIRLMGLEKASGRVRPPADTEAAARTVEAAAAGAKGLFGDSQTAVVLAGTSYSLRGNFHGYLQESLGARVLNTAKDGGGFLQALTGYLKDESFRTSKPRLLVWEIPERLLNMPLAEEKNWLQAVNAVLPEAVVTARDSSER